jgi:NADH-quinone oxidoreductase subunit M
LNQQGILGGQLQMVNHGISTGALFLLVGIIYERRHTREITDFGGLSKQVPIYSTIFAITMLSSIGLPGLNGFVGEFLILIGVFKVSSLYAAFAVIGIILGAAYMLWLFQRMFFGVLENPENQRLTDCNKREVVYMLPLILLMFWIGLYPKPFLDRMEKSVSKVVRMVNVAQAPQGKRVSAIPNPVAFLKAKEARLAR